MGIGDTHAKCSLFNKALECWSQRIFDDDLAIMSDPDKYQALMMLFELSSYFKENNLTRHSCRPVYFRNLPINSSSLVGMSTKHSFKRNWANLIQRNNAVKY